VTFRFFMIHDEMLVSDILCFLLLCMVLLLPFIVYLNSDITFLSFVMYYLVLLSFVFFHFF